MPSKTKKGQLPHYRVLLDKIIAMNSLLSREHRPDSVAKVRRRRNPFGSTPPAYHMTKRLIVSLDMHDDPPAGMRKYWTACHPLCIRISLKSTGHRFPWSLGAGHLDYYALVLPMPDGGDVVVYDTRIARDLPKFAASRLPRHQGNGGYICVFRKRNGDEYVRHYDSAYSSAIPRTPRLQDTWRLAHTCDSDYDSYAVAATAATRAQSMCRGLNATLSRYGPGLFTVPLVSKGWSYLHATGAHALESGISLWNGNEYVDTFRFMDVRGAVKAREQCQAAALNAITVRYPST